MHARELVEVAGLVALHGPQLIEGGVSSHSAHLEQYWSASRCRFESWSRALKAFATLHVEESREDFDQWIQIRAALDEIFTSEILTRVWSAVLVASDRKLGLKAGDPIARNVLATHAEARHRALTLLVHGTGLSTTQAVAINRLRRRAERWTDVLLGGLLHVCDVTEFSFRPDRAEDFAADLAQRRQNPGGRHTWRLTLVSLRNAFHAGLSPIPANPQTNARITASVLGCFQPELFDSTGIFQPVWMLRMSANASDVQGLIGDLLESKVRPQDRSPSAPPRYRRI